ncbi:hypothetical protein L1267_22165 [Pseudoalteromonas sp. OFAV1]|uniref:hypothetical protein n=1 Tax=Pseudoalteromonas sp. OFAV1 TaxID=2908892 RepID=UPI001F3A2ABD|nr:hypothetical protein [Pseudoalteromonas sp. OFAV1]MCF2903078.1 hypothetical protein [Pseudoalteromonas sp. OFAV1]
MGTQCLLTIADKDNKTILKITSGHNGHELPKLIQAVLENKLLEPLNKNRPLTASDAQPFLDIAVDILECPESISVQYGKTNTLSLGLIPERYTDKNSYAARCFEEADKNPRWEYGDGAVDYLHILHI